MRSKSIKNKILKIPIPQLLASIQNPLLCSGLNSHRFKRRRREIYSLLDIFGAIRANAARKPTYPLRDIGRRGNNAIPRATARRDGATPSSINFARLFPPLPFGEKLKNDGFPKKPIPQPAIGNGRRSAGTLRGSGGYCPDFSSEAGSFFSARTRAISRLPIERNSASLAFALALGVVLPSSQQLTVSMLTPASFANSA